MENSNCILHAKLVRTLNVAGYFCRIFSCKILAFATIPIRNCLELKPFSITNAALTRRSEMQAQSIESKRGRKIAAQDGHGNNKERKTTNCILSGCTKKYKLKCLAFLKTKNGRVIETSVTHNHDCDPSQCRAKKMNQIKTGAQYSTPTLAIDYE